LVGLPELEIATSGKTHLSALDDVPDFTQCVWMRKKIIVGVFVLLLLVAGYFANYGIRTTRPENLRELIEKNVKIGDSPETVIDFLDRHQLEHGPIRRTSEYRGLRSKYGDAPMIGAIKRRTWRSLLMYESIQIDFVFDKDGRLQKFDLHPVYTGL
jgi:hypothetical protein